MKAIDDGWAGLVDYCHLSETMSALELRNSKAIFAAGNLSAATFFAQAEMADKIARVEGRPATAVVDLVAEFKKSIEDSEMWEFRR